MTEGKEGFSPNETAFKASVQRLLLQTTQQHFGVVDNPRITKDLPRVINQDEWKKIFQDLSPTNQVRLFDASYWMTESLSVDIKRLSPFDNLYKSSRYLAEALGALYSSNQVEHLYATAPKRIFLLTTSNHTYAASISRELGIPYSELVGQSFDFMQARVYGDTAKKVLGLAENGKLTESEQRIQENTKSYLDILSNITRKNPGELDKLFDLKSDISGIVYPIESDLKASVKNLSIDNRVKLYDATMWALNVLAFQKRVSGLKKDPLEGMVESINDIVINFFDKDQQNILIQSALHRRALLVSTDENQRRTYSRELGLSYDSISWSNYHSLESHIYRFFEKEMINLGTKSQNDERDKDKNQGNNRQSYADQGQQNYERSKTKPTENVALTDLIKDVPPLEPQVYKDYRGGGFELGRHKIQDFDRAIIRLLKSGKLVFDAGDRQTITTSKDSTREDFAALKQLIDTWGQGNPKTSEAFAKEIACSAERIYLHHELRSKLDDTDPKYERTEDLAKYFGSATPGVLKNPGVIMSLGLILTNNTRRFVDQKPTIGDNEKNRSYIKNKQRELAKTYHPDALKSLPEAIAAQFKAKFREINDAYSILQSDDNFRRYSIL